MHQVDGQRDRSGQGCAGNVWPGPRLSSRCCRQSGRSLGDAGPIGQILGGADGLGRADPFGDQHPGLLEAGHLARHLARHRLLRDADAHVAIANGLSSLIEAPRPDPTPRPLAETVPIWHCFSHTGKVLGFDHGGCRRQWRLRDACASVSVRRSGNRTSAFDCGLGGADRPARQRNPLPGATQPSTS